MRLQEGENLPVSPGILKLVGQVGKIKDWKGHTI
jgi:hypothetical protein